MRIRITILFFLSAAMGLQHADAQHVTRDDDGITILFTPVLPDHTKSIRLEVVTPVIIHVVAETEEKMNRDTSLMVIPRSQTLSWTFHQNTDGVVLVTDSISVHVSKGGNIRFENKKGKVLLEEEKNGRQFFPVTIDAGKAFTIRQGFTSSASEAFYGLGQHQEGIMNYKGHIVDLLQNNTEVAIPFVVSNHNYGILWENYSITHFGDGRKYEPLAPLSLSGGNKVMGELTAIYINKQQLKDTYTARSEVDISYDDLSSLQKFPPGFLLSDGKVIWEGIMESSYSGMHQLKVRYGGYVKLWINNQLILDRWRQCWNPATVIVPVLFAPGKINKIKIEWIPDGGESYISCRWLRPATMKEKNRFEIVSEAANAINYYFIAGRNADEVISGYRYLTGKASIVPKWALGFWQSRERYKTQHEVMSTVRSFREKNIPLDNIVLDWQYWKPDEWGSQQFDTTRFPDPKGMIDSLHKIYHTKLMISVWPKFYKGIKNYNLFNERGWLLTKNIEDNRKDWLGYVSTFYDAFNPDAGKFFWQLVKSNLYSKGVDAWWMDAPEPDIHSNLSIEQRKRLMYPNAIGSADLFFNAYPLVNAKTIYEGLHDTDSSKRSFILTRSAYGGLQRYGAAVWSGDIASRWHDMKNQVAAGMNFSMSGIPYWTMDIGGFAVERRFEHAQGNDLKEWKELQTRWYQFGSFCPLFRVHGQYPFREIFNTADPSDSAYQSMLYYNKLRYRLLPYYYTLAADCFHKDYTMMRGLVMDFPTDKNVLSVNDQFMMGPSLLVSPVCEYGARSRKVYLPAGNGWYDLYTGKYFQGGQTINANASYDRIPVFVKEGSIIPFGPALQYSSEKLTDTIHLFVYTGSNAKFDFYEDDGISTDYEKGKVLTIPISYNEQTRTLSIHSSKGIYKNMPLKRVFLITWVSKDQPGQLNFDARNTIAEYSGKEQSIYWGK